MSLDERLVRSPGLLVKGVHVQIQLGQFDVVDMPHVKALMHGHKRNALEAQVERGRQMLGL